MNELKPYSRAIVKLLKGTVEKDDNVWNDIIIYQNAIREYLNVIGLDIILKQEEGFAYLTQIKLEDEATINLASRRKLSFEVSVIIIMLRQMLEDFDNDPTYSQSTDKFVSADEIKDEVELIFPKKYNKVKFEKDFLSNLDKIKNLGYLVETQHSDTNPRYRIHRIIKEKVTVNDLVDFKKQMEEYYGRDESI